MKYRKNIFYVKNMTIHVKILLINVDFEMNNC